MSTQNRNILYTNLLNEFCSESIDSLIDSGYPYLPFMPVIWSNYGMSNPRIFYVGRDTYYWIKSPEVLKEAYVIGDYSKIFNANDECVTPQRLTEEWSNNKGQFWLYVCRLHLMIRTGKLYSAEDLRHLNQEEKEFLKEIGWGNLNSIETTNALKDEDLWPLQNTSSYWKAVASSNAILNPLKNLIASYKPDYIFILSWPGNEEELFRDLKWTKIEQYYEYHKRALYRVEDFDTKIIWTSHPRALSFMGENQDNMIPYLVETMTLF